MALTYLDMYSVSPRWTRKFSSVSSVAILSLMYLNYFLFLVLRPLSIIGGIYSEAELDSMPDKRQRGNPLVTDDESSFEVPSTGSHLMNKKTIGIRLHGTHNKPGMNKYSIVTFILNDDIIL